MAKKTIIVQEIEIRLTQINSEDYICITDMIRAKDGDFFISDWLRNSNTLEYLNAWEELNNPSFNYGEFAIIRKESGVNSFKISVKDWTERTNAIGLVAKAGRYGGTFAHKDIAFNFGMWISPMFQLYVVKEYQRLKELESNAYNLEWNVKRILSKANYKIHTDAVRDYIVPKLDTPKPKNGFSMQMRRICSTSPCGDAPQKIGSRPMLRELPPAIISVTLPALTISRFFQISKA